MRHARLPRSRLAAALALAGFALPGAATANADPLVHTYSIVARDPATGEMGVAVQSHWFSVGSIVTWAEAGVGVVATQSLVEPAYGPKGLELMRQGVPAAKALEQLVAADTGRNGRQVAMIDATGAVDAYTGPGAIAAAGHHVGAQYSVQANMMGKPTVWPAMAKAFEAATGSLADRLVAALEAAEREGGDVRGRQSAALVIVKAKGSGKPWVGADRVYDLRVDDHPQPVAELKRLVRLQKAYTHANRGDELMTEKKVEEALEGIRGVGPDRARDRRAALLAGGDAGVDRQGSRGGADLQGGLRQGTDLGRAARTPARGRAVPRRQAADRADPRS